MAKGGFLFGIFSGSSASSGKAEKSPLSGEIGKTFQPQKGSFFRTLEYAQIGPDGEISGKDWMEAGRDEKTGTWVLWRKAIRTIDDPLKDAKANILTADALHEKTDFVTAYDEMVTFEMAQEARGAKALLTKSAGKLGGDYYKQFAWREGLMMSRSGRLYPVSENNINAANYFDQADIQAAKDFLERLKTEQYVPVPLVLPAVDWEKAYAARKTQTDERLNLLYHRHGDERDSFDLALQVIGHEAPEVLYAYLQKGFKPNIFAGDPAKHFALVKAAIDRPQVETLHLLTKAGIDFYVRYKEETPLEIVLQQHRYSHLHIMLERDGEKLANYSDECGNAAAVMAIALKDSQAFRMLYLEGLDFTHTDAQGWSLVHHAFENSFLPGVYAWIDEGLSIDAPIKGTPYTGLSIARRRQDQAMIDFALKNGANAAAPDFSGQATPEAMAGNVPSASGKVNDAVAQPAEDVIPFSADLMNSTEVNARIEASVRAHVEKGGSLNVLDRQNVSLLELCWRNRKADPALDRRGLLPLLAALGADPAAQLSDGTTVLTRITSANTLDMDFLKAMAPLTRDVNSPDANGNNLLHTLQMNASDAVGHSNNVLAVLRLFPALDINRRNADGLGNVGLAVRLNRGQTLKNMPPALAAGADFGQLTAAGWSVLDIAFTSATGLQNVTGAPRAAKITTVSEPVRTAVLDLVGRIAVTGSAPQKASLSEAFRRTRPDGKTLLQAASSENPPPAGLETLRMLERNLP